jgi:hypothetical protein
VTLIDVNGALSMAVEKKKCVRWRWTGGKEAAGDDEVSIARWQLLHVGTCWTLCRWTTGWSGVESGVGRVFA